MLGDSSQISYIGGGTLDVTQRHAVLSPLLTRATRADNAPIVGIVHLRARDGKQAGRAQSGPGDVRHTLGRFVLQCTALRPTADLPVQRARVQADTLCLCKAHFAQSTIFVCMSQPAQRMSWYAFRGLLHDPDASAYNLACTYESLASRRTAHQSLSCACMSCSASCSLDRTQAVTAGHVT